jgi:hypothetical protein
MISRIKKDLKWCVCYLWLLLLAYLFQLVV